MGLSGINRKDRRAGHQGDADKRDTAARHELFHALAFGARVIITVPFQQVDGAPDTKTCAQGNDQGLQYTDCAVKNAIDDSS